MAKLTFEQFQATRKFCLDFSKKYKTLDDVYASPCGFTYGIDGECYIEMLGGVTQPFATAQFQLSLPLDQYVSMDLVELEKRLYEDYYVHEMSEE